MARGAAASSLFRSDDDRIALLVRLAETSRQLRWDVLVHALLGTHYHLLVDVPADTLAGGMQLLNGWYAQRFNRIYRRRGPLFEGRYKAVVVERDAHLLWLIRYIGGNAREAGLCSKAEDWPWTNYGRLVSCSRGELTAGEQRVLALFDDDHDIAVRQLRAFVDPRTPRRLAPPVTESVLA